MNNHLKKKPDLSFATLWNISFGFFGVQIAYALQSANISRIFATLGADPHSLSYFWILPPLMGILVQPVVGTLSDKTWCRFGRRIPYLFVGALVAVLVMCLLPNAGSFGMAVSTAMTFGLISLMFLDTSINMAMQPFKMLVGDMVNEKQKALAYSIQSFLCNAGSLVGYVFPFLFTFLGISNEAAKGVIPDSVIYSFYIGAAILILCVIYTSAKVKEMPPKEYAEYHGLQQPLEEEKANWFELLRKAPTAFWTVGIVQFFCWAAFLYMWTYTNGTIADTVWHTTDVKSAGYQEAGNWVGILFAVQAIGSVVWATILPRFSNRKMAYGLSLVLGGIGFILVPMMTDQDSLSILAHRLCMGSHAGHAFHHCHQCAQRQPHGYIPWLVQRHHLHPADYRLCPWRCCPQLGGQHTEQHDDSGRRTAAHRCGIRGHHQRNHRRAAKQLKGAQ